MKSGLIQGLVTAARWSLDTETRFGTNRMMIPSELLVQAEPPATSVGYVLAVSGSLQGVNADIDTGHLGIISCGHMWRPWISTLCYFGTCQFDSAMLHQFQPAQRMSLKHASGILRQRPLPFRHCEWQQQQVKAMRWIAMVNSWNCPRYPRLCVMFPLVPIG